MNWASATIGLMFVRCIPMGTEFLFARHVLTDIGVFPIYCEVGAHLLSVTLFFLLANEKLLSCRINRSSDDPSCDKAGEREPYASCDSVVANLLVTRLVP